jgi:hypothetical protein
MDEDDDEHAFSRGLVEDYLEQAVSTFEKMETAMFVS